MIACSRVYVSLDEELQYEGLSYMWGDPKITTPIHLNRQTHSITVNLEVALRNLRYKTEERVLWCDATCIDQDNMDKRGHQVRVMKRIFASAKRLSLG